jgi:hypothetical protein
MSRGASGRAPAEQFQNLLPNAHADEPIVGHCYPRASGSKPIPSHEDTVSHFPQRKCFARVPAEMVWVVRAIAGYEHSHVLIPCWTIAPPRFCSMRRLLKAYRQLSSLGYDTKVLVACRGHNLAKLFGRPGRQTRRGFIFLCYLIARRRPRAVDDSRMSSCGDISHRNHFVSCDSSLFTQDGQQTQAMRCARLGSGTHHSD